jgi:hypothetical protein
MWPSAPPLRSKKSGSDCWSMIEFRYRGRKIRREDILYIRALIERHPQRKPLDIGQERSMK